MSALWLVIPLALLFAAISVAAFIWTVRSGQLDDLETPSSRMLFDDGDELAVGGDTSEDASDRAPSA